MRPDRAIVKKAISDAGGNLTRAAALLGCADYWTLGSSGFSELGVTTVLAPL